MAEEVSLAFRSSIRFAPSSQSAKYEENSKLRLVVSVLYLLLQVQCQAYATAVAKIHAIPSATLGKRPY
jgi:hypothetical protein